MMRHGITALPVVDDDGGVVGILTEADLVTEPLDRDPSPDRRSVQRAMTREVLTVEPTLALEAATARMLTGGRRALPVVDGRRLVGILTRRDVLAQADDPAAHPGAAPRGRALAHLRNHRFRALAEPEATDRWENDGGAILPTEP
jgi:CBS-domain-containing membrane protein